MQILSEELVRAKVLPEDYDFEAHKELVPMQPGDVPVTYADTSASCSNGQKVFKAKIYQRPDTRKLP